jgi:hypothetical protein
VNLLTVPGEPRFGKITMRKRHLQAKSRPFDGPVLVSRYAIDM